MSANYVIKLHFHRSPDYWGRLIQLVTRQKFTHVYTEANNRYAEAALFTTTHYFTTVRADLSDHTTVEVFCTQRQYDRYQRYIDSAIGTKYNLLGAVFAGIGLPFFDEVKASRGYYCSQLIKEALMYAGVGLTIKGHVTPQSLYDVIT